MLKEFVTFNDFIIFLAPGVIISLPTSFYYTLQYFKTDMGDKMEVNLEQLLADNPIRNHQLLIKTGVMLTVVIMGFFMHPLTHIDREHLRRRCNLARPFSRRASESGGLLPYKTTGRFATAAQLCGSQFRAPSSYFSWTITTTLKRRFILSSALHIALSSSPLFPQYKNNKSLSRRWDTLIFFAALFVMVEGLAEMGLLRLIGAPHAHLLPCHSFSHTNLKSPCVEQGGLSRYGSSSLTPRRGRCTRSSWWVGTRLPA